MRSPDVIDWIPVSGSVSRSLFRSFFGSLAKPINLNLESINGGFFAGSNVVFHGRRLGGRAEFREDRRQAPARAAQEQREEFRRAVRITLIEHLSGLTEPVFQKLPLPQVRASGITCHPVSVAGSEYTLFVGHKLALADQ